MARSLSVLVTGATGKQGGAVARQLLKKGHTVRGLTRKLDSPAAQALAKDGVELVQGSFEDKGSLVKAARGVDTVFAMSTPFEAGPEAETRQGVTLADAAKEAGVGHFVFTSVAGADQKTGIPHFDSKYRVEEHIKAIGLPHTIVAPVYFMENLQSPFGGLDLNAGRLASPLTPGRALQQIAVDDVGAFSVAVIDRRESMFGKRFDIASDELSGNQLVEIVSRVTGKKLSYVQLPREVIAKMGEDFARMFDWFESHGYSADLAGLRRDFPEVRWHRFEEWARAQRWG
ncbi:MAG TPA: NmrA/HSCARG family protein [Myxococcaceae bacterium]|nr:NmrA/HSCARG family protein [Myxococcaceae bacterium]